MNLNKEQLKAMRELADAAKTLGQYAGTLKEKLNRGYDMDMHTKEGDHPLLHHMEEALYDAGGEKFQIAVLQKQNNSPTCILAIIPERDLVKLK